MKAESAKPNLNLIHSSGKAKLVHLCKFQDQFLPTSQGGQTERRVKVILNSLTNINIVMDSITAVITSSTVPPLHEGALGCVSAAVQAGAGADVAHQAELIRQETDVLQEDLPDGAGAELLLLRHGPCLPTINYFPNLENVQK